MCLTPASRIDFTIGWGEWYLGLFLWLRPSQLRGIEEQSNQWVSSRKATKVLDVQHDQVDEFVMRHAQKAGWLLLLGSIYLFFVLFRLLA